MVVYSKEYLEEWRKKVVEPHVMDAQKMGIDALKSDNMTDFVLAISRIAQDTENHVDLNYNMKYIFDYGKEKPPTIKAPKAAEEAKGIIEQIAEEKKSMLDIFSIVEKDAEEKFKSTNPEYYIIRDQIYEEDLFDKLRNKIEEKRN